MADLHYPEEVINTWWPLVWLNRLGLGMGRISLELGEFGLGFQNFLVCFSIASPIMIPPVNSTALACFLLPLWQRITL